MNFEFGCTCGATQTTGRNHQGACPYAPKASPLAVAPVGWMCAVCGGGVSPLAQRCPCVPTPPSAFPTILSVPTPFPPLFPEPPTCGTEMGHWGFVTFAVS